MWELPSSATTTCGLRDFHLYCLEAFISITFAANLSSHLQQQRGLNFFKKVSTRPGTRGRESQQSLHFVSTTKALGLRAKLLQAPCTGSPSHRPEGLLRAIPIHPRCLPSAEGPILGPEVSGAAIRTKLHLVPGPALRGRHSPRVPPLARRKAHGATPRPPRPGRLPAPRQRGKRRAGRRRAGPGRAEPSRAGPPGAPIPTTGRRT